MSELQPVKIKPFDAAAFLETDEDIQAFLVQAANSGDTKHLLHCLGVAVRARGMSDVAKQAGVTHASLYKSFNEDASLNFETIVKVLEVFGCKLSIATRENYAS